MTFLRKSGSSLALFNSSWAMHTRRHFSLKFNNFGRNFANTCFMPKTSEKIAWNEPTDMPTSSTSFVMVIRRISITIFCTDLTFSSADMFRTDIVINVFAFCEKHSFFSQSRLAKCWSTSTHLILFLNKISYRWSLSTLIFLKQ